MVGRCTIISVIGAVIRGNKSCFIVGERIMVSIVMEAIK